MENQVDFEEKKNDLKTKVGVVFNKTKDFCVDHKEALLVLIPVVVSGTIELIKIAARSNNTKEERHLKEDFVYDRSAGHYYELNSKPSSSDWRTIDLRRNQGETLGEILDSMGYLK